MKEESQSYRASVAAYIINSKKEVLFVQNHGYPENLWDTIKGGMNVGEEPEETLVREITEELGKNIDYKILRRAWINDIYDWPKELQEERGFRGQARISYWIKLLDGEININKDEIKDHKWVKEDSLEEFLISSSWSEFGISTLISDLKDLKSKFSDYF